VTTEPPPLPIATPPGWYYDPAHQRQRWWDGIQWAFFDDTAPAPPVAAFPAPPPVRSNGIATASLVLGIVGLLLCTTVLPSILAVIFGIVGVRRARERQDAGRGNAIAGIVLGSVALLFAFAVVASSWT
jgi:hypothetical protein